MKFENVKKGLKQVFTGEIMELLSTLAMTVMTFFGEMGGEAASAKDTIMAIASIGLIAGMVFSALSTYFRVLGVANAKKDESNFTGAFVTVLLSLALTLLNSPLKKMGLSAELLNALKTGFNTLTMVFIVNSIIKVAGAIGNDKVEKSARKSLTFIVLGELCVLVVNFLSNFIKSDSELFWIPACIACVSMVLSVVSYFMYLKVVNQGSKML